MDINNPQTVAEVTREFNRYQQAILNNDVAVLNELFWNNTLTLRYGIGENLYGYAAIAAFRGARDPASALRVVGKNVVTTYGRDRGVSRRARSGQCAAGGRQERGDHLRPRCGHHQLRVRARRTPRPSKPIVDTHARRLAHRRGACELHGRTKALS